MYSYDKAILNVNQIISNITIPDYRQLITQCYNAMLNLLNSFDEQEIESVRYLPSSIKNKIIVDYEDMCYLENLYKAIISNKQLFIEFNKDLFENCYRTVYLLSLDVNRWRKSRGLTIKDFKLNFRTPINGTDSILEAYRNLKGIENNKDWFMELYRLSTIYGTTKLSKLSECVLVEYSIENKVLSNYRDTNKKTDIIAYT